MEAQTRGQDQLRALFLERAARLGRLYRGHIEVALPRERAELFAWALYSTLADCARLGIGSEARTVFTHGTCGTHELEEQRRALQVLPPATRGRRHDNGRGA
jgi:hypothetical protein